MKTRIKKRKREQETFLSRDHLEAKSIYGRKGRSPVPEGDTGIYWDGDSYGTARRTLEEAGRRGKRLGSPVRKGLKRRAKRARTL